mmetsp:Transcript_10167/g.10134  ORF Transcript_10167/g.10134 Transcript_10167/m.10134 type:complete len:221 (-) Transcript_10167:443-1105(-)
MASGIGTIAIFALRSIPSTVEVGNKLNWVLRVIPTYCLTNAVMFAGNNDRIREAQYSLSEDPMDLENMGGDLLFLFLIFVLSLFRVVGIEFKLFQYLKQSCSNSKQKIYAKNEKADQEMESEQNLGVASLVKIFEIQKHYSTSQCLKKREGVVGISNLNIDVQMGECLCLLGANGAGKTTLFNLLTGFTSQDSGGILVRELSTVRDMSYIISHIGIGYCP